MVPYLPPAHTFTSEPRSQIWHSKIDESVVWKNSCLEEKMLKTNLLRMGERGPEEAFNCPCPGFEWLNKDITETNNYGEENSLFK